MIFSDENKFLNCESASNCNDGTSTRPVDTLSVSGEWDSSWVEISQSAFEHNLAMYKSLIGNALFAPVIKSNAYGHGIEIIAKLCDESVNVDYICVVSLSEAIFLRSIGIKKPILVLSIINASLGLAIVYDIDIVIYDINLATELSELAKKINKCARVHIKIDTGLSRLGILHNQAIEFVETVNKMHNISIVGLFTHYASSESSDQTFTDKQFEKFNLVIKILEEKNIYISYKHTTCSAAVTSNIKTHCNFVRSGIGIYGLWPSAESKVLAQANHVDFYLKPVLSWNTRIISIKNIPAHSYIGYNLTYKTECESTIATLPIGYWDGFDRRLSNIGKVLINGNICSIVGKVAMNLCMVDVTGLNVAIGDKVILIEAHHNVSVDSMAEKCGTINYEVVARINPLLPRRLKA